MDDERMDDDNNDGSVGTGWLDDRYNNDGSRQELTHWVASPAAACRWQYVSKGRL